MTDIQCRESISTARLSLRRFTEVDVELMLAIWNDPDFVRHVGDRGIRTLDEARDALRAGILAMYDDHGFGPYRMATRDDDQPLGICGLFHRDFLDDPDIGFGLLPAARRHGYALEASRAVLDQARREFRLPRVTAIVSPRNAASLRLLANLGLRFERRLEVNEEDTLLYAIEF